MYITSLSVDNIKLLANQTFSFTRADGSPRMWTVLIGDNGLCKTTILQAIALITSGEKVASALVPNARELVRFENSGNRASISATFLARGVSEEARALTASRPSLAVESDRYDFVADEPARVFDLIRGKRLGGFFVAGYGVGRSVAKPGEVGVPQDFTRDRIEGLFDPHHRLISLEFAKLNNNTQPFSRVLTFFRRLHDIFEGNSEEETLLPSRPRMAFGRFEPGTGPGDFRFAFDGQPFAQRAGQLSQGYRSTIAWISDLIGQAMFEAGGFRELGEPALEELEGVVLLDEIDLHLHPTWQRRFVPVLKRLFPKLQFIVTTHSPLVLTGFEQDEIIELHLEEGLVVQRPGRVEPGLLTASELLSSYFDVPRAGRPELVEKEREFLVLDGKNDRTTQEEALWAELRRTLAPYWGELSEVERESGAHAEEE
ncbi:MAG: AAA family ATPase [Polyangiaceae bacterium]